MKQYERAFLRTGHSTLLAFILFWSTGRAHMAKIKNVERSGSTGVR